MSRRSTESFSMRKHFLLWTSSFEPVDFEILGMKLSLCTISPAADPSLGSEVTVLAPTASAEGEYTEQ